MCYLFLFLSVYERVGKLFLKKYERSKDNNLFLVFYFFFIFLIILLILSSFFYNYINTRNNLLCSCTLIFDSTSIFFLLLVDLVMINTVKANTMVEGSLGQLEDQKVESLVQTIRGTVDREFPKACALWWRCRISGFFTSSM